ncbi:hypothetical protein A6E01_20755 (plasmid) [Vibrio breoganii]|uniref:Tyr recombinase domain-containing protein n=1 Tax=Vibrio breoganii TaxID=553239 RepID=A0AAN1CV57_9VIBR|nr:site-specific integrase [Vibrio breoganii]ANO35644.1 hypothetical protein A6E01_20755 [Vibrio breoganii]
MFTPLFPVKPEQFETGVESANDLIARMGDNIPTAGESYELAVEFLLENKMNQSSFRAIRKELNLLFNWSWRVKGVCVSQLNRVSMREFVDFCAEPPLELISRSPIASFKFNNMTGEFDPHDKWRPFSAKDPAQYVREESTIKSQLSLLSSYYTFLSDMEFCYRNPAATLLKRMNVNNTRVANSEEAEKSLTIAQWECVWNYAVELSESPPEGDDLAQNNRARFLLAMLYHLYPRISEVTARPGHTPRMNNFKIIRGHWFYKIPRSKGGKTRSVACPHELVVELKRYRKTLGLSSLPTPEDESPLLVRVRPASHGREAGILNAQIGTRVATEIVKDVFKHASLGLIESDPYAARELADLSPHALRHTGIQREIENGTPLSVVMANTGHSDLSSLSHYSKANVDAQIRFSASHEGSVQKVEKMQGV